MRMEGRDGDAHSVASGGSKTSDTVPAAPGSSGSAPSSGSGRRGWRVPNRLALGNNTKKLMGSMVAGAKQRVASFGSAKYVHRGTSCQLCETSPIVGARYNCAACEGFDLCEKRLLAGRPRTRELRRVVSSCA